MLPGFRNPGSRIQRDFCQFSWGSNQSIKQNLCHIKRIALTIRRNTQKCRSASCLPESTFERYNAPGHETCLALACRIVQWQWPLEKWTSPEWDHADRAPPSALHKATGSHPTRQRRSLTFGGGGRHEVRLLPDGRCPPGPDNKGRRGMGMSLGEDKKRDRSDRL